MRQCPEGTIVLATAACEKQRCPDGVIIDAGQQCVTPVTEAAVAPPKVCPGGETVAATATCQTKKCPDGTVVGIDQQCPTCWSCKFFPLTEDTAPYWGAVAALVALIGGGGMAAAKAYNRWRIGRTAQLLHVSSSLDPAIEKFRSSGLKLDGPSIRLRAYLDPGEI
jgi:hypothetical protein